MDKAFLINCALCAKLKLKKNQIMSMVNQTLLIKKFVKYVKCSDENNFTLDLLRTCSRFVCGDKKLPFPCLVNSPTATK